MDKFIEFPRAYKTESQRSAYDLQHRNTWKTKTNTETNT